MKSATINYRALHTVAVAMDFDAIDKAFNQYFAVAVVGELFYPITVDTHNELTSLCDKYEVESAKRSRRIAK